MSIISLFKGLGTLLRRAFGYAQSHGLTDELVEKAKGLAVTAARQFTDNAERREWVVARLVGAGVPESLARLALELGLQVLKAGQ